MKRRSLLGILGLFTVAPKGVLAAAPRRIEITTGWIKIPTTGRYLIRRIDFYKRATLESKLVQ